MELIFFFCSNILSINNISSSISFTLISSSFCFHTDMILNWFNTFVVKKKRIVKTFMAKVPGILTFYLTTQKQYILFIYAICLTHLPNLKSKCLYFLQLLKEICLPTNRATDMRKAIYPQFFKGGIIKILYLRWQVIMNVHVALLFNFCLLFTWKSKMFHNAGPLSLDIIILQPLFSIQNNLELNNVFIEKTTQL